jgi:peptidoglycan/LPS O-acetylase OafA/YrhL
MRRVVTASLGAGIVIALVFAMFSEPRFDGAFWRAPLRYESDLLAGLLGGIIGYRFPSCRRSAVVAGAVPMAALGVTSYFFGLSQGRPDAGWYYLLAIVMVVYGAGVILASMYRDEETDAT